MKNDFRTWRLLIGASRCCWSWRSLAYTLIVQLRFEIGNFLYLLVVESSVSVVIAYVEDDIGYEHYQQYKRAVFQHPDLPLQFKQQGNVFAVVIHV